MEFDVYNKALAYWLCWIVVFWILAGFGLATENIKDVVFVLAALGSLFVSD